MNITTKLTKEAKMFNLLALLTTAKILAYVNFKPAKLQPKEIETRKQRVERARSIAMQDRNEYKVKQAEYLLRVLRHKEANIQIKNIHTFN